QLMMNFGDPSSFTLFTLAAVLLTLALVPLSLTRMEAPVIDTVERMSFFTLLRESSSGVAGSLICGVLISSFYALGPVYATLIGLNLSQTSVFMATAIVAAMLLAWPLGKVGDRVDRRRMLMWVALASAVASALVAVMSPDRLWLLMLVVGVFTGLTASLYPIAVAITNDRMEHHRIVAASATLLLSYGIGGVVGPVVMAKLVSVMGPPGLFVGSAGFLMLLAAITYYRIRTTYDIPVDEQEQFVAAMPDSSPVLSEIDPRNESFEQPETTLAAD
ncbi:MAG: MFS transporter, partial [Marinobacter sp.]|nr:MFS transporter [Marinobacter sp.]